MIEWQYLVGYMDSFGIDSLREGKRSCDEGERVD